MAPQFFFRRLRFLSVYITLCASLLVVNVNAQGDDNNPPHKTYAVIGAFTVENNANRLVELVKKYELQATVRHNEHRGLYYVFIDQSDSRSEIVIKVKDLKKKYTQFYDAWAYTGDFQEKPESIVSTKSKNDEKLATGTKKTTGVAGAPYQDNKDTTQSNTNGSLEGSVNTNTQSEVKEKSFEKKENHYYLYFNTINSKNLKEVKGKVNIIDPERAKQLKEAKSHELVELADPDNGTRRVKVATDMFGFREVQYTLDLDDPASLAENPAVEMIGDSIVVNFDLKRFKKGDVLVMYNVYFFKDAAIMKPESIYELNSFLDMLKENENLVVQIHGHTNGNSHGKIIHLDLDDKNFFGINGNHKESNGSAKKLSLYRAYTIQHWLMEQGIAQDRMEIKGWGGKKMIYDKHSTQADKNVRVEVEILEE
ncbi:MAG: OmpA family protein [Fulvivirga sp.]